MQFKLAFVTAAIATPVAANPRSPAAKSVQPANSAAAATFLSLFGIVLQDLNVDVGLTCSPITVIGTSSSCSAQAVCCEDNSHGGLVSIGCVPVTL
ncbi:hydrophobin 2 [Lentinula aciculospora]|uniref:Hydrophobin n=1 Tax=Lentinula aciculospora TaxID=153920 RepID=A0A9W9ALH2_9AGAR|nr:hydrophobin 2 [Lentinula aciculospora]